MPLSATNSTYDARSRSLFAFLLATTANVLVVGTAQAEPTCQDFDVLCSIGTFTDGIDSRAKAVSANGLVVVGYGEDYSAGEDRAFIWNATDGMLSLGILDGGLSSKATAVNFDGTIVVGIAIDAADENPRAFRWTSALGMQDLGVLDGGSESEANGVSADGSVVVGFSESADGDRAFKWTLGGTMVSLGALDGNVNGSNAQAVSGDGSVVVGRSDIAGYTRAVKWNNLGEITNLGTLDGGTRSSAEAISSDGNVIVGTSDTTSALNVISFRWTQAGGMLALPELEIDRGTFASAVSSDGSVVVGVSNTSSGSRAFRWTEDLGIVNLGVLGVDDGNARSEANGVSADGSVVVGMSEYDNFLDPSNNFTRAFIWRTEMQDFENLMLSFPVLANDTEIAVSQQQSSVKHLMDGTFTAGAGQSFMRLGGWLSNGSAKTVSGADRQNGDLASISYGRGISDQTTLGASISLSATNPQDNGFDMGNAAAASLWASYSESGVSRTGIQASVALGWGHETGSITRGRDLTDVMLAIGNSDLETIAASASVGFGFVQKDWRITPSATLAQFRTSRDAYSEVGSDFNAVYDGLESSRTTATLAISAERRISEKGQFSLGAGLEHDMSDDRAVLTGVTTVPGMETLDITTTLKRNLTRGFLDVGYTQTLSESTTLSGQVRIGQAAYGNDMQVGLGMNYAIRF